MMQRTEKSEYFQKKTNLDEKKDDKERIKTEKEAVIAAAASWNLKGSYGKGQKGSGRLSA